jgi:inositol phosphorylceramide mannosyltransferase catalytic subunit
MIPRLIHQTAKTADIPPRWREFQRRVRELHPEWTYKLWTDEDNLAFVKAEFPDFLDIFQKLPRNIMRADVIRYLLLYRLGGLYLDLDYEMLKSFDLTEHDIVLPWEQDGEFGAGNDLVCQAFFASAPGHPFLKMLIDDLRANPPLAGGGDVEGATGPKFVTRVYHRARAAGIPIHTPRRNLFNPVSPRTRRQYQAIVDGGESYGIHHCDGSWRDFTLTQRFKNVLIGLSKRFG